MSFCWNCQICRFYPWKSWRQAPKWTNDARAAFLGRSLKNQASWKHGKRVRHRIAAAFDWCFLTNSRVQQTWKFLHERSEHSGKRKQTSTLWRVKFQATFHLNFNHNIASTSKDLWAQLTWPEYTVYQLQTFLFYFKHLFLVLYYYLLVFFLQF